MRYCFNPNCPSPENVDDPEICRGCGAALLLKFQVGEGVPVAIRGQKLIGQGGFGRTLLAVNVAESQQRCVVKQLLPFGAGAGKASALFYQEAEKLKVLGKHPQIPDWIAHFEQDSYQYLVQEFIEGKNLAQILDEQGVFDESQIRQLLKDLLPVLRFIHSHKIIHRDIKPANIIRRSVTVENDWELAESGDEDEAVLSRPRKVGQLVLVDFGAAKLVTHEGVPHTGTLIGSAAYTAPEQLMGKAVFASDLYSLGVTCIHLLTMVSPFDLFDSQEGSWNWRDYLHQPVSQELGDILDQMLVGATNRRYESASAVLQQLSPRFNYMRSRPLFLNLQGWLGGERLSSESLSVVSADLVEFQAHLQEIFQLYQVKIQVNQTKTILTIVISREKNMQVDYPYLGRIITRELSRLQGSNITRVKLLGRVETDGVPEWKTVLKFDWKMRLKNKLAHYFERIYPQLEVLTTTKFWLEKSQSKLFWTDVLMFLGVFFIFSAKIIVFHPVLAGFIAAGFISVKHLNGRRHLLETQKLFNTIMIIAVGLGLLNLRTLWITNSFGLLIACLFIALPAFYVKDSDF